MKNSEFKRSIPWDEENKLCEAHEALRGLIELCGADHGVVINMANIGTLLTLIDQRLCSVVIGHRDGRAVTLDREYGPTDAEPVPGRAAR